MRRRLATAASRLSHDPLYTALAFAAATFALLTVCKVWATVHLDTARDLLIARECVAGSQCPHAGPESSFPPFVQGALWIHLLEMKELCGLGFSQFEHGLDALLAAAAGLVVLIGRRIFGPQDSLFVWAVWFPATLVAIEYPNVWNPSLDPIVLTLFQGSLLYAVFRPSMRGFMLAAFLFALAVDTHIANVVMALPLAFALIACDRRPVITGLLCAAVVPVVLFLDSSGALERNTRYALPYLVPLAAAFAGVVMAGAKMRPTLLAKADRERVRFIAVSWCAYLVLLWPVLGQLTGHAVVIQFRYFYPIATPAALVIAERFGSRPGTATVRRRSIILSSVAVAFYVLFIVGLGGALNTKPRLRDVEIIAAALYGRGLSFSDLYRHLRGPHAFVTLATLAALEPTLNPAARSEGGLDLLLFRTARPVLPDPLPQGWTTVDLDGDQVAVIAEYQPYVRTDRFEFCTVPSGKDTPQCMPLRLDPSPLQASWIGRAYPSLPAIERAYPSHVFDGMRVSYRFTLQVPPDGDSRRIMALETLDDLHWQIDGTTGSEATAFPNQSVGVGRLPQTEGWIEFSVPVAAGKSHQFRAWLPSFVEVQEGIPAEIFAGATRLPWPLRLARWLQSHA